MGLGSRAHRAGGNLPLDQIAIRNRPPYASACCQLRAPANLKFHITVASFLERGPQTAQLQGPCGSLGAQRGLIQRQQLCPGALGSGLVVDRHAVLQGHVPHAPAMLRATVHFDLCGYMRGCEGYPQLVFYVRLARVVIRRYAEIHLRPDLRRGRVRYVDRHHCRR